MPIPENTARLKRNLARDEVHAKLKSWILNGSLRSGEKIRDKDLAATLGTSRTPVREALRRLEDEGLVETAVNRWTRVSSSDLDEARRVYPIIRALESLATMLASPNLHSEGVEAMERANVRLEIALRQNDPIAASLADCEFHQILILACGNPDLISILDSLKVKLRRFEIAYYEGCVVAHESTVEHRQILDALVRKDFELAASNIARNWEESLKRVIGNGPRAKLEHDYEPEALSIP